MSAAEQTPGAPIESRSSIKVVRNAKGDVQVEVKVYVGDSEDDLNHAREWAVSQYRALEREFGSAA